MTDQTIETTTIDPEATMTETTPDTDDNTAQGDDEARRYRKRAQAAEAERDELQAQLAVLQRRSIESASDLAKPGSLWLTGIEPAELLGDDGHPDAAKIAAADAAAVEQFGLARKQQPLPPDPGQGARQSVPEPTTFADSFKL